jgi:hypothetical protein
MERRPAAALDVLCVSMWSRLLLSGSCRRRALAAPAGGVSHILDFDSHLFITPDLTVALSRVPVGDWIGFDVGSRLSGDGFGQAESLVFDADSPVGRAVQSVLVERP